MATFISEKKADHDDDENSDNEIGTAMDELCSYDDDEVKEWHGIDFFKNIFYIYLYHKYKQPCVAVGEKGVALVICDAHQDYPEIIEECVLNVQNNKNIIEKIRECIDKDNVETLLIPVSLYFLHRGKIGRHANLLLYRKFNKTIEVFEPNGVSNHFIEVEYTRLSERINDKLPPHKQIRLIRTDQVCQRLPGLQHMQSRSKLKTDHEFKGGYCLAWSMYFGELVLKNPTKTSEQILQNIHKKLANLRVGGENEDERASKEDKANYLLRLIRGYVHYISKIIEDAMRVFIAPWMRYDNYIALSRKDNPTEIERDLLKPVTTFEKDFLKINMDLFENGQDTVLDNLKKENPHQYRMYEEYISQYLQPFSEAKSESKEESKEDTTDNKKARPGPGGGCGYERQRLKKTKTKNKTKTKKKKTKTKKIKPRV